MKFKELQTIQQIKIANPLFFETSVMDSFKSRVYDCVKVTEAGTYFITSEILKYERVGDTHELIHKEEDRIFSIRFVDASGINKLEEFDSLHRAKIYLDKLDHDNGGFRISQHEANQAKLRLLGVK
tara:strand:+ start:40 stop:417 length:378 start_codon:yes stop_codon:yes gene_type:complete